jgi:fused signal recognition particle receptor
MAAFFSKIRRGISKTRDQVFNRISLAISLKSKIDEELLEEIEEILISGDVGVETTMEIMDRIKSSVKKEKYENAQDLFQLLKDEIIRIFPANSDPNEAVQVRQVVPYVILVVGVNGTGKTTFIAKLARKYQADGKAVLLVAGDTFRAAAIEQLQEWADRINVEVIKHQMGADPGAVVFDALNAAKARKKDIIIVDTAGRLHTKVNLMEELKKIKRVMQRAIPDAPHEAILVLDATTGQNSISQAKQFIESVGISGIALTKLDGTAKGGATIGIAHQLGLPVQYIGVGESIDDLEIFDPKLFVDGLFETENTIQR